MKLYLAIFSILFLQTAAVVQPVVYDNFEGKKLLKYGSKNTGLDTVAVNPHPDKVNGTAKCAKYTRNATKKFDNIKMAFNGKLEDVSPYSTYLGIPPKLKMKIYTTAPVGTLVEILLGSKGRNTEYPAGTHSQYQAHTTTTNAWEELEFKFAQIPEGSETSAVQVDQLTLLFDPNSASSDTYYFDDITGPVLKK
jgi:hypothetical protein